MPLDAILLKHIARWQLDVDGDTTETHSSWLLPVKRAHARAILKVFKAGGCSQSVCDPVWQGIAVGEQAAMVSSPAVANGVVYVGENNGMVEVFDANGCGQTICEPLTQLRTDNEQIVSSSPAVVNGTVYFGSADQFAPPIGRLYVFTLSR